MNQAEGVQPPTARALYFSGVEIDREQQEQLERSFFASLKLRNGTYKFTYSNRLNDLNRLVNSLLPTARPLHLMDVAVSSGISTLEWIQSLDREGIEHDMTAGDLTMHAFLVSITRNLHVLVDNEGYPLQYEVKGKAIANPPGKRMLLSHPLSLLILRTAVATKFKDILEAFNDSEDSVIVRTGGLVCRRLALVSPRFNSSEQVTFIDDDILTNDSIGPRFHAVRAANVLNRAYFSDEALTQMLKTLRRRLLPGGLFIACRTHSNNENHGTVFRHGPAGQYDILARINSGSEIEDLFPKINPDD